MEIYNLVPKTYHLYALKYNGQDEEVRSFAPGWEFAPGDLEKGDFIVDLEDNYKVVKKQDITQYYKFVGVEIK